MEVRFVVPDGYWLEGLAQIRPELTWRAYLRTQEPPRSHRLGTFCGAVGRTPQEAIDKAQKAIEADLAKQAELAKRVGTSPRPRDTYLSVDDLDL